MQSVGVATSAIKHRGPDEQKTKVFADAALGHARLSIIDTSSLSAQPFADSSGRFTIVFNGEIFNYKSLRKELESAGVVFRSNGDVEVLLELFKKEGSACLTKLRGFFAFAVFDSHENKLFLARDRFGVKPLYYYLNENCFAFASEIRSLFQYGDKFSLNTAALFHYMQLNYIPGDESIANEIKKLTPGSYAYLYNCKLDVRKYYDIKDESDKLEGASANNHSRNLREMLEESVRDRLVSDVPVGSFLSGGIDSTIISGIASKIVPSLATFSLGFTGNKWFDESPYAETAARAFGTEHHTFMMSNDDLFGEMENFLDAIDEPFADSSALNVYVLSKKTRPFVKTVLSGDGADEIFAGYNKHRAEWLVRNSPEYRFAAGTASLFSSIFPKSRNSGFSNKMRQVERFASVMRLPLHERYWSLASISDEHYAGRILRAEVNRSKADKIKNELLCDLEETSINSFLLTDVKVVLEGDMLVKVDRMSMANGLEVRNPFLDHRLVAWALALPQEEKINRNEGKIILKKAFADIIPAELLTRKKHGFEVPLHKWMKGELRSSIENDYLNDDKISQQQIFSVDEVRKLKSKLFSDNPGDSPSRVWAIIVFNHWYKRHQQYFA